MIVGVRTIVLGFECMSTTYIPKTPLLPHFTDVSVDESVFQARYYTDCVLSRHNAACLAGPSAAGSALATTNGTVCRRMSSALPYHCTKDDVVIKPKESGAFRGRGPDSQYKPRVSIHRIYWILQTYITAYHHRRLQIPILTYALT